MKNAKNAVTLKTCGCGQAYDANAWKSLRLVGHWCFPETEDFPEEHLELRDCVCGSTLSVDIVHEHSCALRRERPQVRFKAKEIFFVDREHEFFFFAVSYFDETIAFRPFLRRLIAASATKLLGGH